MVTAISTLLCIAPLRVLVNQYGTDRTPCELRRGNHPDFIRVCSGGQHDRTTASSRLISRFCALTENDKLMFFSTTSASGAVLRARECSRVHIEDKVDFLTDNR